MGNTHALKNGQRQAWRIRNRVSSDSSSCHNALVDAQANHLVKKTPMRLFSITVVSLTQAMKDLSVARRMEDKPITALQHVLR